MELIWDSLPRMLSGILLTIELTAFSVVLGLILAVPLALLYIAKNRLLSMPRIAETHINYYCCKYCILSCDKSPRMIYFRHN